MTVKNVVDQDEIDGQSALELFSCGMSLTYEFALTSFLFILKFFLEILIFFLVTLTLE